MQVRPAQILRVAGVSSYLLLAAATLVVPFLQEIGPELDSVLGSFITGRVHPLLDFALHVGLPILLAVLFWINTRPANIRRPGRLCQASLTVQAVLALLIEPELLILIAAEAGLLLEARRALIWAAGLAVVKIAAYMQYPGLAGLGQYLGLGDSPAVFVFLLLVGASFVSELIACSLGLVGGTESRQRLELERMNAQLQATQQMEANAARLAERLDIARELHDAIGHRLTALSVTLQLANRLVSDKGAEQVADAYEQTQELLGEVREVVSSVRRTDTVDLSGVLQTMARSISQPRIHLELEGPIGESPPLHAHTLFRCCQEIITNTVRHAAASNLWLNLSSSGSAIRLQARDDGRGARNLEYGNGLNGIRERVEGLGGGASFASPAGSGFEVNLRIPLREGVAT